MMKEINVLEYKGFKTRFFITEEVNNFLKKNHVSYEEFLPDNYHFYENILFKVIDEDGEGIPDEKCGKEFEVIFYRVVEKWTDVNVPIGFSDNFDYFEDKILEEELVRVSETEKHPVFGIKYKLLMT